MLWMLLVGCSSADAEEIAAVMLVTGDAHIRRGGVDLPAEVGALVDRTDTLVTGEDGAIIVQLRNDHLVRVDADLELRVTDIVVLDAPPSSVPPGQQLADFLYPEEADALGGLVPRAERVAGWTSRITSADAVSGVERQVADLEEEGGAADAPPKTSAAAPRAEKEEEERRRVTSPRPRPASPAKDDAKNGKGRYAVSGSPPSPPPPPPGGPGDNGGGSAGASPGLNLNPVGAVAPSPDAEPVMSNEARDRATAESWFAEGGEHRQCVVEWAATLPVDLDAVRIRIRIQDGVVTRVNVGGGLATPACIRDALQGATLSGGDGTFVLEVAIP